MDYNDSRWRIVPADQALTEGARWVYLDTYVRYNELPLTSYRQIALFSRLVKAEGVLSNQVALLPDEVADYGIIEFIDNRKAVNRQIDQRELLSVVLEF